MGSYLLDLGNSNDGPIGMVLRVNAGSKAEAVEVARRRSDLWPAIVAILPSACRPRSGMRLSTSTFT